MVKTVNIRINEVASDFAPVPADLGYRDAIAMLKRPETSGDAARRAMRRLRSDVEGE